MEVQLGELYSSAENDYTPDIEFTHSTDHDYISPNYVSRKKFQEFPDSPC